MLQYASAVSREECPGSSTAWDVRCALLAAAIVVASLARFDVVQQPIVTDVRYAIYFGSHTAQGQVPHRDFFDNRTQLSTFTGAAFHALGDAFGIGPLIVMRLGYLAIAALTGLLLFEVHRRLSGRCSAGLLAVLGYVGLSLLGFLPSVGPLPKGWMAALAYAAALLAHRRRWIAAGACGALAAFDWQIGAIAALAVLASALLDGERRVSAIVRAALGMLLVAALYYGYFAVNGALGETLRQEIGSALARGQSTMESRDLGFRLMTIKRMIDTGCPGHAWLAWLGVIGALIFPLWLVRHRGRSTMRLALSLAVYNYGVVAFSLVDFQRFGDLFILLQSLAFFAGVATVEALRQLERLVALLPATTPAARDRREAVVAALAVVVLGAAVAWSSLGRPYALPSRMVMEGATLDDQREVAAELRRRFAGKRIGFLGSSEAFLLADIDNLLPFIYWNDATYSRYRLSDEEEPNETLIRILKPLNLDVIGIPSMRLEGGGRPGRGYRRIVLRSANGRYRILLLVRRRALGLPKGTRVPASETLRGSKGELPR